MTINLAPEQLAWIEARVADGAYPDIAGAVQSLLADAIQEHEAWADDDLAWAKPLIDEALMDVERGNFKIVNDTDAYIDTFFKPAKD